MQVFKLLKGMDVQAVLIMLVVAAALCVVALFVTGALMSMDKPDYGVFLTIHRVVPFLAVISMAAMVYILVGRQ